MKLAIEDLARFPRPGMADPGKDRLRPRRAHGHVSLERARRPHARALVARRRDGRAAAIFGAADVGGGATDANVSLEEELRRERQRLRETGITHYEWAAEAPVLLVPVRGELFVRRERPRAIGRHGERRTRTSRRRETTSPS